MKGFALTRRCWTAIFGLALILRVFPSTSFSFPQSIDELEQQAFQSAGDFAQECVVQIEAFGGLEFVNKKAVSSGPSTGTILTSDGWIAASLSYFRGQPASITVMLSNGTRKPAKLVARDLNREIAILKIEPDAPLRPAVPSDAKSWQVGQWMIALGKTFDPRIASRSVGILSAQGRIFEKAIQTDCKISPQNYGGPVVDLTGRVMGILTLLNPNIATEGEVEQWYDSGVGFAIPIHDILERLPLLKTGEDIYPGKIGIRSKGQDEFKEGVFLIGVSPGGPAAKAGLQAGDKILKVGRSLSTLKPVATYMQFRHGISPIDAQQSIAIEVDREGTLKQFELSLVKELPEYREPYVGIVTFREADQTERVLHVVEGSPASSAGIVAGETVTKMSGLPFQKDKGLEQSLWFLDFRSSVDLTVRNRDGQERTVTVQPTPRPAGDITLPKIDYPSEGSDTTVPENTIQQIPMGDVKNRAFVIVPTSYRNKTPHGLLIIFAEPGQQDSKLWADHWEKFGSEHRWLIAVIQSAEEKTWSFEEVEIANRVRSHIANGFAVDDRRRCIAGLGSGSVLAIITNAKSPTEFRSMWISDGKLPGRVRILPPEPGQSLRLFVNGNDESLKKYVESATIAGLNVNYDAQSFSPAKVSTDPSQAIEKVQRWLRFQEAF